jgi:urate oxidase
MKRALNFSDGTLVPLTGSWEKTMSSKIILGENQYGKAEVRVVKITRESNRHEIEDLNVTSQLRGDFAAAHLEGDNAHVVATDTQKNTIYAFARDGIGSPEEFL